MQIRALLCLPLLLAATSATLAATAPSIQSVQPSPGMVSVLTQVTVTFSKAVTGIEPTDLWANGNPAASVSGAGSTYTFVLERQPDYGNVAITWDPSHSITDLELPPNRFDENAPGSKWQYLLVDTTAPNMALLSPAADLSIRSLAQIEVTFSEPVTGVDAGDLLVNDAPALAMSVLGAGRYRFTFNQPPDGTVTVRWAPGHGIQDLAPVPNTFAGGSWSYTLDPTLGVPTIRINEFLASNVGGLADEDGEAQDWIELWNFGSQPINLAGLSLTDDREDPGRWTFPATNIAPGQFLVVFASGKDRRVVTAVTNRFHTNFKLSGSGEYLGLFTADAPRAPITEFAPEYPEQRNNASYGYDASDELHYFGNSTPGGPNGASTILGLAPPPHANVERGYFDAPFTLLLNCPLFGATIRYTIDGSEPTSTNGIEYTLPLTISNATVLRAAAFKANYLSSPTITHTYFFLEQVLSQSNSPPGYPVGPTVIGGYPSDYEMDKEIMTNAAYAPSIRAALRALPSVSIAIKIDDMFGPTNGIYTHVAESATQYRGVAWERPCSMEFVPTNGVGSFQVNCGIRMQGNASRNPQKTPKHPMRLIFKGDYGPGRLEQPVFPDSPVRSFNTLIMRADFNNSWLHWDPNQRIRGTRIRDAWVKDSWRAMGQPGSHSYFFHLYINGLYWGVYEFGERIDATFAANNYGGNPEDYDAIASKPTQAIDGDITAYNAMIAAARTPDMRVLTNYIRAISLLDVTNHIDYLLLNFYGANQDWGLDSNWNAIRRRAPGETIKYISWDGEQLLVGNSDNRVSNTDVPSGLHVNLINSPEYRLTFADRAHKHLFNNGALSTNAVVPRWLNRAAQLQLAIVAESARWGDYRRDVHQYQNPPYFLYTPNDYWQPEVNRLVNSYFPQRGDLFLGQLRTAGLYPNVSAPSFNQHGGLVARGFNLTMTATNQIYFTVDGSDPRVFGTSALAPTAQLFTGPLTLNQSVWVKARALAGTNWSALNEATFTVDALGAPLRITEIMYNPPGGDAYEFIELKNTAVVPLAVGQWTIDGLGYSFPPNTLLAPGQTLVLGSDVSPGNWSARYPGVVPFGRFSGKLDNGGEKLAIRNAAGDILWSVDYDDEDGWPAAADGFGASLEIIDLFGDPDDPANWRASLPNGTPGVVTPPPPTGQVVLNEVMAENLTAVENGGFHPDWVELQNTGAQAVNLGGWSLTDDSNPRKYVLPANTMLASGEFLVIWCDTNALVPGLRAPFALGRNGESVILYDANTNRVDAIGFGVQLPDMTIGRFNGHWTLTEPTPGSANAEVTLAAPTNLTINEWLADAPPGGDDWIELHNRASSAVALQGLYLGAGNAVFQLSALSYIGAGGYLQLLADEKPGANHLDFKLPLSGGSIALFDAAGQELERVNYSAAPAGVTQGRLPDGDPSVTTFPASPSPGASNYLLSYDGPLLHEVLAVNHAAATNSARHTGDFVELRNPNASPFVLAGMRLSNTPDDPLQWVFPPDATIPAQGYLVVWFDEDSPASTNNGAFLNTGYALDGESGAVWLFNAAGQPVDHVTFGFQVEDRPIGRVGSNWILLAAATPNAPNAAPAALGQPTALRLNEWLANSPDGNDWFELYNSSAQPVALEGVCLTDTPAVTAINQFSLPPLSFIGANGFVRCVADGHPSQGRNHVNFSLDGDGETLRLSTPALVPIDTVPFGSQRPGVSRGRLPDGADSMVDFAASPTPARSNYQPLPSAVINEALTHTDAPLEDSLELYNPTATPVDISGWFLSDAPADFKKFRIQPGTTLPAFGYRVFTQSQLDGGPGSLVPFTLDSARGDEIWLSAADASGTLTGLRASATFGAAANGVSFGRYVTSQGRAHFVAQENRSLDGPNTLPKVGPVVLNELMYHPPDIGGTNDNVADEFIELYNLTTTAVPLYDAAATTNTWQLRGAVRYRFPTGVSLASRAFLLVVSFDPVASPSALAAFRSKYALPVSVPVYGPYFGKLDNGGEVVQLFKPDPPQGPGPDQGFVPYVLVDEVEYDDAFPWPVEADGAGSSLQRNRPYQYGNDPVNWRAAAPSPGRPNAVGSTFVDADGDGLSDTWETANGVTSPSADADGDGHSNYEEFLDGTNPQSSASRLEAPSITGQPQDVIAVQGSNIVLSVTANGTAPRAYQWYFNGNVLPGANSASLPLFHVDQPDAGLYRVSVWNQAGFALSREARLTINLPPRILAQPQPQSVNSNAPATFNVTAIGTGVVRYQWQFNGANLPNATNSSFTVSNSLLGDEGEYRVLVTDDIATIASASVRLTVRIAPVILVAPVGQTNIVGSTLRFTVTCSGSVPMGFQWRKGSLPITNESPSGWIVLYTTNAALTLSNVQTNDSAVYRLIVTNLGNISVPLSRTFTVLVVAPPSLSNQPQSQIVAPGATANFVVVATGSAPLAYQWYFKNAPLNGATNATLTVTNAQDANEGAYYVTVSNLGGTATSVSATLSLNTHVVLGEPQLLGDGSIRFNLRGVPNRSYAIETSSNLLNWTTYNTIVAGESPTPFTDSNLTGVSNRFYRARELP
jgi:hypothetical protein